MAATEYEKKRALIILGYVEKVTEVNARFNARAIALDKSDLAAHRVLSAEWEEEIDHLREKRHDALRDLAIELGLIKGKESGNETAS